MAKLRRYVSMHVSSNLEWLSVIGSGQMLVVGKAVSSDFLGFRQNINPSRILENDRSNRGELGVSTNIKHSRTR